MNEPEFTDYKAKQRYFEKLRNVRTVTWNSSKKGTLNKKNEELKNKMIANALANQGGTK